MSQPDLTIVVKDDPFSDLPPRLISSPAGTPLSEVVSLAGFTELETEHIEASINGEVVPAELWAATPCDGHTHLIIVPKGGGDDGNKILRTVLTIAVIVAAFYLGPEVAALFAAEGTKAFAAISAIATGAISVAGQLAINAIVPPPGFREADPPDPVYFIEGARNRLLPFAPLQTVLGEHRLVPQLLARPYPEIRGDDTYYYMVLDWGPIGVEVTDLKVGDTPLSNFDGVSIQSRLKTTDPHPTMASRQVLSESVGATLLQNDEEVRRTVSDTIDCDLIIAFPQGLGKLSKKGNPESNTASIRVRYREVINPGPAETFGPWQFASTRQNVIYPEFRGFAGIFSGLEGVAGIPEVGTSGSFQWREAKPAQPFFRQIGFSFPSEGTWEVGVMRSSEDRDESRVFDDMVWQTLLSKRDEAVVLRDDVAYSVIRFKGTDETSGAVDEVNGVVRRLMPSFPDAVLDQADLSTVTAADLSAETVCKRPWEQILWLRRNGFDARLPETDDGINWPSYARAAKDARDRGLEFNYVIRNAVDVDALTNLIASTGGEGRVYSFNNILTAGLDRPIPAPSHVFRDGTARNIQTSRTFPDEVHAFRVTFNDAANGWRTRQVIIYVDGYTKQTATRFEDLQIYGKTGWDDLHRHVAQLYRNAVLQNETMQLEVPIQSVDNTLRPMSRVTVVTRVMSEVIGSGIIRKVSDDGSFVLGLTLDQEIPQGPSEPALMLKWASRTSEGESSLSNSVALAAPGSDGLSDQVTFESGVALAGGPSEGDEYFIGLVGEDFYEGLLADAEQAGEDWLRLSLKAYAPARFDETGLSIPAYATAPVLPLGSRPPTPQYVSAEASNYRVVVKFDLIEGYEQQVREIRVWRAFAPPVTDPEPDTLSTFEQLPSLSADQRQYVDGPGNVGDRVVYRFQAVADTGRVSAFLDTPIITVADALPAITNLAATPGYELGGGGVQNPVIAMSWDAEDDAAVRTAVVQVRTVAKDGGGVRLPEGSQPDYDVVAEVTPEAGAYTFRGLAGGVDYDVAIYYRGSRGEVGALYEVQDVTLGNQVVGDAGSVDWGNITNPPVWVTDGRAGVGLAANGDLVRNIPQGILDGSSVLRRTGGGLYAGELDATRGARAGVNLQRNSGATLSDSQIITGEGVALDFVGRGALATLSQADWASHISGRPVSLTDGRVAAGLTATGDLARNISTTRANSSNLLRRTAGGLFSGDLDSTRGARAGVNLQRNSGATLSDSQIITGEGVALDFVGRGALATLSQVDWGTHVTGAGRPEDNADVTANAVPYLQATSSAEVFTGNYTGAIDAGQQPRTVKVTRKRGSTDVSSSATWSIVSASGCTASVSSNGTVTINNVTGNGQVVVRSVRDGITLEHTISVTRSLSPPPQTGGGGGSLNVQDSTFNTVDSSVHAVISDTMIVDTGANGDLEFSAPLTVIVTNDGGNGNTYPVRMKWQYRTLGGSWTDVAAEVETNPDAVAPASGEFGFGDPGSIICSPTLTTLAANTSYEVRLLARHTTAAPPTAFVSGTASVAGS